MKKFKRMIALLLAVLMISCVTVPTLADSQPVNGYVITNPYKDINWETINFYKTALHTHTNASDGDPTLKDSIQRHVETGFDIVATTDHGTVNYSWETENPNKLIHGALSLVGKSEGDLVYLGKEGKFDVKGRNGEADSTLSYTLAKADNGDDYLTVSNGAKVMRVPYGIENNALSANAHVNGFFVDYHNNFLTTYSDAIKGVNKLGGVSVINHPGEYTKARYELHSADAYNESTFNYWYHANKFASLLKNYDRCIGIDMNSKGDARTRFDRILWDNLLVRFASTGRNIFGICSSDAHQLDKIDTGFTIALMPELSSKALSNALLNGQFFGASHCIGNYDELVDIASALKEFYGETDLYGAIKTVTDAMAKKVADIESGEEDADSSIGIEYDVLDREGYCTAATQPAITSIEVDDASDTITINTENALIVRWISDGKLVATAKADGSAFSLPQYKDKLGSYVRAEVFGEGGIIYTQAFLLNAGDGSDLSGVVDFGFVDLGILDCLIAIFNNWGEVIVRFFKAL